VTHGGYPADHLLSSAEPLPTTRWDPAPYAPKKYAIVILVPHVTDDRLEGYAMQVLPNSETGPTEEHFLICQSYRTDWIQRSNA